MNYESLADIFTELEETTTRLNHRLAELNDDQHALRSSPESWSVGEIAEHISIVDRNIGRMLALLLSKAEAEGNPEGWDRRIGRISVEPMIERSRREKYTAPDGAVPKGDRSISDSLSAIREARASLNELKPRMEAVSLANVSYPHPAFGPLTPYQWLVLIGLHEQRHLDQIEAVLANEYLVGID